MGEVDRLEDLPPSHGPPTEVRDLDFGVPLWASLHLAILVVDRLGAIRHANVAALRLLGEAADGAALDRFVAADHRHDFVMALATAGPEWQSRFVGFVPDVRGIPTDMLVHLRSISDDALVVLMEPSWVIDAAVIDRLVAIIQEQLPGPRSRGGSRVRRAHGSDGADANADSALADILAAIEIAARPAEQSG